MSMSKKLYLNFGFVLAMVVVLFVVTWVAVEREQSAKAAAQQALAMTEKTDHIRSQLMQNRLYLGNYLLSGDGREVEKLNEGVGLPDAKILVVHREDSSGTTSIFTDYLHGASAAWREEVGAAGSKVKWPAGVGVARNHGVADKVYRTEGAIGYVDLLYASYGDGKLQHGAVRNKGDTAFIHAESEKMTAALKGLIAAIPEDLTFQLTNRPGKDSYPICGAVWAVCYQAQPASDQKRVVDFLHWVTHEGQKYAKDMSYAPLPEELVGRADENIKLIKVAR